MQSEPANITEKDWESLGQHVLQNRETIIEVQTVQQTMIWGLTIALPALGAVLWWLIKTKMGKH